MPDEYENEFEDESGSGLRRKLEEALKQNRELVAYRTKREAGDIIGSKGFQFVKPEDLHGVPFDQLEAKASELETERKGQAEGLLRSALQARGLDGDELEAALVNLGGETRDEPPAEQPQVTNWSSIEGKPPSRQSGPPEGVTGPDRIRWAANQKRK